jgi:hypothetical protein
VIRQAHLDEAGEDNPDQQSPDIPQVVGKNDDDNNTQQIGTHVQDSNFPEAKVFLV